jgi:uncharacterized protein YkwD
VLLTIPAESSVGSADAQRSVPEKTAAPAPASGTESGSAVRREPGAAPVSTADERRFVELVNRERVQRGLSRLEIDPVLITVARRHSAEMRDRKYFDHNSPSAGIQTPMDRYRIAVRSLPNDYACVGENLFYCSVVDVQRGHNAFMTSPTHRENVLYPRFERIGVGIVRGPGGQFWVTQMFLTNTPPESVARNTMGRVGR